MIWTFGIQWYIKLWIENDEWIFRGKILLKYVCFGVNWERAHNLEVYPDILLIIQTHVEENELRVGSTKRSWLEEPFVVLVMKDYLVFF